MWYFYEKEYLFVACKCNLCFNLIFQVLYSIRMPKFVEIMKTEKSGPFILKDVSIPVNNKSNKTTIRQIITLQVHKKNYELYSTSYVTLSKK